MSLPHNEQNLGKPLRSRKKRSAVFIVIVASIAVHVLAGLGLAAVKIIEVLQPEPEFEAPPVVEMKPPPPPPPPPPTTKRSQRSLPRPQPLAVKNAQNTNVPAIEMNDANLTVGGGRGFGGGLGALGGAVADSLRISFFGMESTGSNIVVLLDCSWSGAGVFDKTRRELLKTMDAMKGSSEARLSVIYFGGHTAGQIARGGKNKTDPTKSDFWYPKGVPSRKWIEPATSNGAKYFESIRKELKAINPKSPKAKVKMYKDLRGQKGAFFVLGTQYWGALNAAYGLKPAPATIYFMVEPGVAFPSVAAVKQTFAIFQKKRTIKAQRNHSLLRGW